MAATEFNSEKLSSDQVKRFIFLNNFQLADKCDDTHILDHFKVVATKADLGSRLFFYLPENGE
jgi:hypothetical protein